MKRIVFFMLVTLVFMSCRPYQEPVFEVIKANETAFLIPLEGANKTNQAKFGSIEYLDKNKVATKRVEILTRWVKTGRSPMSGEYIKMSKLIKVDRSPVSREWTDNVDTGTSTNKQSFELESKGSIGFNLGITASAIINEDETATFQYFYAGKPLTQIMDKDVRQFAYNKFSTEFSKLSLNDCRLNKADIVERVSKETKEEFVKYGITIRNLGAAGQLKYNDKSIQDAINNEFISETRLKLADNAVKEANKFLQAQRAITAKQNLDASVMLTQSIAKGLESGNIQLPSSVTIVGDSGYSLEAILPIK